MGETAEAQVTAEGMPNVGLVERVFTAIRPHIGSPEDTNEPIVLRILREELGGVETALITPDPEFAIGLWGDERVYRLRVTGVPDEEAMAEAVALFRKHAAAPPPASPYVGPDADPSFEPLRNDVRDDRNLEYNFGQSTVPGLLAFEATHRDFGIPICVMYYRHDPGSRITIGYVFTHEQARRCGLASRMLYYLGQRHPATYEFCTGRASDAITAAWLKKNGFIYDPLRAYWTTLPLSMRAALEDDEE